MDNGEIDVLKIWDLKGYLEELKGITDDEDIEVRFRLNHRQDLAMEVISHKYHLRYDNIFFNIYDTHRPSFKQILDILSQEI